MKFKEWFFRFETAYRGLLVIIGTAMLILTANIFFRQALPDTGVEGLVVEKNSAYFCHDDPKVIYYSYGVKSTSADLVYRKETVYNKDTDTLVYTDSLKLVQIFKEKQEQIVVSDSLFLPDGTSGKNYELRIALFGQGKQAVITTLPVVEYNCAARR